MHARIWMALRKRGQLKFASERGGTQKGGGGFPQKRGGSNPGANCEVSQSLGWMLKSPKKNTFADGLIERTSSILDGIE